MWIYKFAAKTSDHLRKYHPHSSSCPPTVVLVSFKMHHFNKLRIALIYPKLIGLNTFVLRNAWKIREVCSTSVLEIKSKHACTHTHTNYFRTVGQRHHSCCKAILTLCQVTYSTAKAGNGKCSLWSSTKLKLLMDWKFLFNFTRGQKNNIGKIPPSKKHI